MPVKRTVEQRLCPRKTRVEAGMRVAGVMNKPVRPTEVVCFAMTGVSCADEEVCLPCSSKHSCYKRRQDCIVFRKFDGKSHEYLTHDEVFVDMWWGRDDVGMPNQQSSWVSVQNGQGWSGTAPPVADGRMHDGRHPQNATSNSRTSSVPLCASLPF